MSLDGYINENGSINTKRLQLVLDEMESWEQEIFEKEYSDMNWFKGKQSKYAKGPTNGKKHEGLGMYFFPPLPPLSEAYSPSCNSVEQIAT